MRLLALTLLLTLSACGFTPLYGTHNGAAVEDRLATVALDNIPNRDGQKLRLRLMDRFYGAQAPQTPLYKLGMSYSSSRENLSIQRNDVATRARLTMVARYSLTDLATNTVVLQGSERAFMSYNILTGPYATIAAEEDATDRGLTQLADLVTNRVALYLADLPEQ